MRRMLTNRALFGVLVVVAVANVAVFVVQRWVALPLHVPSESMEPNLEVGDRILVRRTFDSAAELADRIDRGDVLVFRSPRTGEPLVVKRVIGLPGESIEARDGLIAIDDDTLLEEKWLPESEREIGSPAANTVDIERVLLEDDEVFLLGDNRDSSIDSRQFGPVDLDRVVGTVMVRFWPIGRFGTVDWS